jgi:hypothetical protein
MEPMPHMSSNMTPSCLMQLWRVQSGRQALQLLLCVIILAQLLLCVIISAQLLLCVIISAQLMLCVIISAQLMLCVIISAQLMQHGSLTDCRACSPAGM